MKLFRHRRPSWKTLLGITKAKKRFYRAIGLTALLRPFRWWPNLKRRVYRRMGYESFFFRVLRNGLPTPGGCCVLLISVVSCSFIGVIALGFLLESILQGLV